jgi:hypothetical protein
VTLIRTLARRAPAVGVVRVAAALALATPAAAEPEPAPRQVVAYYQTIYETDADGVRHYVDPTPLLGAVTDVNVGAIHLNDDGSLHVNDITADHPELVRMWADLAAMQDAGVRVHAFLGGAAPGTYRNLADDFDDFYPLLRDFLVGHGLDGVDLDIEEPFSLADTIHLVETLRADFGPDFAITLTPVARDLAGQTSFSGGFAYAELEAAVGDEIDWYNTQFYCGWGDLRTTTTFEAILANGFTPDRVVAGTVTNPGNCSGWAEPDVLDATLREIVAAHPTFRGVFGWEFFNALGHDGGGRETWFSHLHALLNPAPTAEPERIELAHQQVSAGAEQTLAGSGFVPGEDVVIALTAPEPVALDTVVADAAGAIGATFRVPADAPPGEHTVTATGQTGTASAVFTVVAAPAPEPIPEPTPVPGDRDPAGPGGAGTGTGSPTAGPGGGLAATGVLAHTWASLAAGLIGTGGALVHQRRRLG